MKRACALYLIGSLAAATGCATQAEPLVPDPGPGAHLPFAPETYRVPRAARAPVIDGRLDDPAWSRAPWTDAYVDISGPDHQRPRFHTRGKMAWDDTYFYFAAELEEPHLWATYTKRDSIIYHENDWEIFIDPDGDTHHYYELEINVLGTVWDLFLVKPYRDGGPALHAWDAPGLLTAVHADGTINDPSDEDRGWTIEVAWPWASFGGAAGMPRPPRPGDRWRVNFSRVQWHVRPARDGYAKVLDPETGKHLAEDNWVWSPQGAIAMHMPERWGIVEFAADDFPGPRPKLLADDEIRWALRQACLVQQRFHEVHGRWARTRAELGLPPGGHDVYIEAMETGFEIRMPRASGGELVIREDGRVFERDVD